MLLIYANVLGLLHHFCVSFLVELGLIRLSFLFFLFENLEAVLFLGCKAEHVWLSNSLGV